MTQRVLNYLGVAPKGVHRLDMHTSGVLVYCKGKEATARLVEAFMRRRVYKTYLALCCGVPGWDEAGEPPQSLAGFDLLADSCCPATR